MNTKTRPIVFCETCDKEMTYERLGVYQDRRLYYFSCPNCKVEIKIHIWS